MMDEFETKFDGFYQRNAIYFQILFAIPIFILFFHGVFSSNRIMYGGSDVNVYSSYVKFFFTGPELYVVLYFPHFYYFYYPFYLMGDLNAFFTITILNFISIAMIIYYSDKISTEFGIITKSYLLYEANGLGITTNIGPILYFILIYIWYQAKHEKFKIRHLILVSFFIFKPTMIILYIIIGFQQKKYKFYEYILFSAFIILLLNLPFILIKADLYLCICFYKEYWRNLKLQAGGDYDDLSFMAPILFLLYSGIKKTKLHIAYKILLFILIVFVIFRFII